MSKGKWEVKKLGEVAEIINGRNQSKVKSEVGQYPILGSAGTIMGYATDYICNEGTTIIGRKGNISNPIYINEKFWNVDTAFGIYPKDGYDSKFIYYLCLSIDFKSRNRGTTIPSLVKSDLLNINVAIVESSQEQQRIVSLLDEAFESIDQAKANAEKNLENAKELFESYLQSVFETKGEGWEEKELKEIGKVQTGTTPKTVEKENYGNFIPFIKPADVDYLGNGSINFYNIGLSKIGLAKGRKIDMNSILMVCIGATIGKVGFTEREVSCNQQINTLTPQKKYISKFFYYGMKTKSFQYKVHLVGKGAQATLPIINKTKWENLTICYPKSLEEQQSIVSRLDALRAETENLESVYLQRVESLEELRKSILEKAFNGEL